MAIYNEEYSGYVLDTKLSGEALSHEQEFLQLLSDSIPGFVQYTGDKIVYNYNADNDVFIYMTEYNSSEIDRVKAAKVSLVKQIFEAKRITNDVDLGGGIYMSCGEKDVLNIQMYVDLLVDAGQTQGTVRGASNEFYTLPIAELQNVLLHMKTAGLGLFQWKWTLEVQIAACTTVEEVNAVVIG